MRSWRWWCVSCVVCLVWASGCSSGSSYERSYSSAPAYAGPSDMSLGGMRGGEAVRAVAQVDAVSEDSSGPALSMPDAPETTAQKAARQRAEVKPKQVSTKRRLVRNGWLTIELPDRPDFEPSLEKLRGVAQGFDGYVQSETAETMKIMIPTDRFEEAMKTIANLGEVLHRNVSVTDVTARFVDLQIRLDNLERMRVRLTELVMQSDDVGKILEIEKELGRVTMEIERIKGQLRLMDQQTSYATIDVTFEERVMPGPLGWVFYGIGSGIKWLFVWD